LRKEIFERTSSIAVFADRLRSEVAKRCVSAGCTPAEVEKYDSMAIDQFLEYGARFLELSSKRNDNRRTAPIGAEWLLIANHVGHSITQEINNNKGTTK
jgi:hypothetical protein